jgi:hypothetical protein
VAQGVIDALRFSTVDARARIHQVLLFLAKERSLTVEKDLADWKPVEGDSATRLEEIISKWRAAFGGAASRPSP